MIDKIINEVSSAVVATIQGADDILSTLRDTAKNQVVGVLSDTGEVGSAGIDSITSVAAGSIEGAGKVGESLTNVTKSPSIDQAGNNRSARNRVIQFNLAPEHNDDERC